MIIKILKRLFIPDFSYLFIRFGGKGKPRAKMQYVNRMWIIHSLLLIFGVSTTFSVGFIMAIFWEVENSYLVIFGLLLVGFYFLLRFKIEKLLACWECPQGLFLRLGSKGQNSFIIRLTPHKKCPSCGFENNKLDI